LFGTFFYKLLPSINFELFFILLSSFLPQKNFISEMFGQKKELIPSRETGSLIPIVDTDFLDDDSTDEVDEANEVEVVEDSNVEKSIQSTRRLSRGAKIKNFKLGRNLKVFVGTWNMGNKRGEGMDDFLPTADGDFDIIAIGLQESTYSVGDTKDASQAVFDACIAHLSQEFTSILGPQYYIVKQVKRAQLQLYIFAKKVLKTSISDIHWSAENTGFLHVFPNKVIFKPRSHHHFSMLYFGFKLNYFFSLLQKYASLLFLLLF
jgi:hypothetical protein